MGQNGTVVKLLLFDVDGTLVLTGGAGVRAMNRAFQDVFGVADAFRGIPMAGRTDPAILAEGLRNAGLQPRDGEIASFEQRYLSLLEEEILAPAQPRPVMPHVSPFKGALPGVTELVARLAMHDGMFLALLTGNYSAGAKIKLAHFDIWAPFRCGAYGEDAALRHELVPVALARAQAAGLASTALHHTVIIGDTPLDVECAHRAGVACVAVATGGHDASELRQAGADVVFDDLTDTGRVVAALESGTPRSR